MRMRGIKNSFVASKKRRRETVKDCAFGTQCWPDIRKP